MIKDLFDTISNYSLYRAESGDSAHLRIANPSQLALLTNDHQRTGSVIQIIF